LPIELSKSSQDSLIKEVVMKKKQKNKDYDDIQKMLEDNKYIRKTKKVLIDRKRASKIYIPPPTFIEIYDINAEHRPR
jgi:hypothetical protein